MKTQYWMALAIVVSPIIAAVALLGLTRAGGFAGMQWRRNRGWRIIFSPVASIGMVIVLIVAGCSGDSGQSVPAQSIPAKNSGVWTQIGPAPLQIDVQHVYQGAGPNSGQVVDIAIDPRNTSDDVIFIATNGGIWKSTDGGATWAPKTDLLDSLSMGAVTLDAANKSIVYAGTGNDFSNGFVEGIGVYVSTDDGETWSLAPGSSSLLGRNIIRMVSPAANTLVVATKRGLFRSIDGGTTFVEVVPTGVSAGRYISDLHLDTATPNTIYAAVHGVGIFKSTDGGATFLTNLWTGSNGAPTAGIKFISFTQTTSPNNLNVWASVEFDKKHGLYGMYRLIDSGATWENIPGANKPASDDGGCYCGFAQTIGVDPSDGNILYLGFQYLYQSTDALDATGSVRFANIIKKKVHTDHHAIAFGQETASPTAVFVGQDGGIAKTTDGGTTWANINGAVGGANALATTLSRGIGIGVGSSTNRQYTYGGDQDTGVNEFRPGFTAQTWHMGDGGDGGTAAVDPCDPAHAIEQTDACFIETRNAGTSWNYPSVFPDYSGLLSFSSFQTVAFDPTCDGTVYVGVETQATAPQSSCIIDQPSTHDLYQSTDNGVSYTKIQSFTTPITGIATVKVDPNSIWVGLNDGTVEFTANALSGASSIWQPPATQPAAIAGQPVTGIAIDPTNAQDVIVVYSGFSGIDADLAPTRHVFMTTNGGATWADIGGVINGGSNNLPDLPLHSVVIDASTNPHTIVVASDAGVMQSADLGKTWQVLGSGMPTVEVTSLALDSSANPPLLRAGTYGRSTFELVRP